MISTISDRSPSIVSISWGERTKTHINILRRSLVLSVADSAILLNNSRPPAVPVAHAGHPAVALGEGRVAHEQDLAVLGAAVDLAPCIHDEGVVGGDDDDEVDALGGELVLVLEVRRDVHGLAARGESAGDGDEDDLLAGELLGGVVRLREAAGGRAGVGDGGPAVREVLVRCSWYKYGMHACTVGCLLELDVRRELVASLDGSHCECFCFWWGVVVLFVV